MSSVDPLFRERLKAVMTLWINETGRYLKKAQENGYLKKTANTRQLAEFIVATEEGSFGLVKNGKAGIEAAKTIQMQTSEWARPMGETNQLGSLVEILLEKVFGALAEQPLALGPGNCLCGLFR